LTPTARSGTWDTEIQKASTVCPERFRPDRSVIVTEATTGTLRPTSSKALWMAASAALPFSVSKTVSTNRRSAPPSRRPAACSW
jgi:hypothetical protein